MLDFKNREKLQALLLITLGVVVTLFSHQNFQYPQAIRKSNADLTSGLTSSDAELQKTRSRLKPEWSHRPESVPVQAISKTQVVESDAPMQLKLKRTPAMKKKPSQKKKNLKKKAKKTSKKFKKKANKKSQSKSSD